MTKHTSQVNFDLIYSHRSTFVHVVKLNVAVTDFFGDGNRISSTTIMPECECQCHVHMFFRTTVWRWPSLWPSNGSNGRRSFRVLKWRLPRLSWSNTYLKAQSSGLHTIFFLTRSAKPQPITLVIFLEHWSVGNWVDVTSRDRTTTWLPSSNSQLRLDLLDCASTN